MRRIIVVPARRLRVRRINEVALVARVAARATERLRPSWHVEHGGGVANAYKYPAVTEGCLVVAWPDGRVLAVVERLTAKGATCSGVIATCTGEEALRPAVDRRWHLDSPRRAEARAELIAWADGEWWRLAYPRLGGDPACASCSRRRACRAINARVRLGDPALSQACT